jgi:hypothetical protein
MPSSDERSHCPACSHRKHKALPPVWRERQAWLERDVVLATVPTSEDYLTFRIVQQTTGDRVGLRVELDAYLLHLGEIVTVPTIVDPEILAHGSSFRTEESLSLLRRHKAHLHDSVSMERVTHTY